MLALASPAPAHVAPCPHHARCAGCPLMAVPYRDQLAHKQAALGQALGRHAALAEATVLPIAGADPSLGYRTRVKWMFGQDGALGMYARQGDHVVVDTRSCLVAAPLCAVAAEALRRLVREPRHRGIADLLVAVDLREIDAATPGVLVTLVVGRGGPPQAVRAAATALAEELRIEVPGVVGVALNLTSRGPQVLGAVTQLVAGEALAVDRAGPVELLATFGAFVQAHRGQAAAIAELLASEVTRLGREPRVLELFAGAGAFGLALARRGAHVTMVESFAPAVELARDAAARLGLAVTAHAADAEAFVKKAIEAGERWDAVVVDPPRRGLSPALRESIARLAPPLFAYVSCRPGTLARDLDHFAALGLRLRSVAPFDMIPQTEEIEAVVLLGPGEASRATILAAEHDLAVVDKPPHAAASSTWLEPLLAELGWPTAHPVGGMPACTSGALLISRTRGAARQALAGSTIEVAAVAKGVTRGHGTVTRAVGKLLPASTRYRRLAVASGHSWLAVETRGGGVEATLAHLAGIGHPVLGDPRRCDRPTRRHFFDKHGLDRALCHVTAATLPSGRCIASPLAGDLVEVLAGIGIEAKPARA